MYKQIEETPEFWAFEEMEEIRKKEESCSSIKLILVYVSMLIFCLGCWVGVCYFLFNVLLK